MLWGFLLVGRLKAEIKGGNNRKNFLQYRPVSAESLSNLSRAVYFLLYGFEHGGNPQQCTVSSREFLKHMFRSHQVELRKAERQVTKRCIEVGCKSVRAGKWSAYDECADSAGIMQPLFILKWLPTLRESKV